MKSIASVFVMERRGEETMKQSIGEQQITPQIEQTVAPDVNRMELQKKAIAANQIKGVLDGALSMAADKLGGHSSTRVKDIDTAAKKIAQKRIEGRSDYDEGDLRDMLGGRLVIDKKDIPKAKSEIQEMSKQGLFKIKKEEQRKDGNYSAYHYDVQFPTGDMGEIQIMTHQAAMESTLNHSMRAVYGENPPEPIRKLQDAQAEIAKKTDNNTAQKIADVINQLTKQNNNKPLNPIITASLAKQAQK